MIIEIRKNTLGLKQQPIATSRVLVRCDECVKAEWETNYNSYTHKKLGRDVCQSCKNRIGITGIKGKQHSTSFKNRQRNRNLGDKNPAKRPEVREKLSEALKGRDVYWLTGKKKPDHARNMRKRMLEIWATDNPLRREYIKSFKTAHSSQHDKFKSWLLLNEFVDFKSESPIEGTKYYVDELDNAHKIVVEYYGDFWHANPNIYEAEDEVNLPGGSVLAEEIWTRDRKRRKCIEQKGYKMLVIWESDFKKDKKKVEKLIREFYEKNVYNR